VCLLPVTCWLLLVLGWEGGQELLLCVARAATESLNVLLRLLLGGEADDSLGMQRSGGWPVTAALLPKAMQNSRRTDRVPVGD
jgi:hypothetical protein